MTDPAPLSEAADRPPIDNTGALARLGVVVIGGIALAYAVHGLSVLVVVVALVAMVMLHELGHFTMAKLSGMKVTEYFFGFGPKLWSIRRGETEYGVKAIPAGGYVRIVGMTSLEQVDAADEARTYRQASFPARFAVAVAGSTVHFLLALILIFIMLVGTGYPALTSANEVTSVAVLSSGVTAPAARAHLTTEDRIVGVDGHRTTIASVISTIEKHPGTSLPLLVERNGRVETVTVRPITRAAGGIAPAGTKTGSQGFIGVSLGGPLNQTSGVLDSVPRTFSTFGSMVATSFVGIGQVFSASGLRSFAHQVATASNHPNSAASPKKNQVISIVGAVQLGSKVASRDVAALLYLLVAINVFVGIINLFPMLPLDGGHVVIALYERVRSRRGRQYHADVSKLMPLAYLFLAFIIIFGLGALYSNILNPVA